VQDKEGGVGKMVDGSAAESSGYADAALMDYRR
jgi:hypothetical protein